LLGIDLGFGSRRMGERPWVSDMYFTSFSLEPMLRLDNLSPGVALRWKVEDRLLGRSGSEMWKAGTSKVVAPACVS
jgi:hypothetical protein